ncbi:MAG: hypothetical protein ACFBZ9_01460 [Sphingomonadales bacterium]
MKSTSSLAAMAAVVLSLNAMTVSAVNAAPEGCLSANESTAEKVRRLKTTLMVGALQCTSAPHLRVTESYNAFVETHGLSIQSHDQVLSGYFERIHGKAYRRAMDRHVTSMANKVATQRYKTAGFCEKVAALAERSLTRSADALLAVAEANTIAPRTMASCPRAEITSADVVKLP